MPFTIKQVSKQIATMLQEQPELSLSTIYDTIGSQTETSPDVLAAAFKGDGTVKLNQDVVDKIAEHLKMKEVGDCPGDQVMNDDTGECEDPPAAKPDGPPGAPGGPPGGDKKESKVNETLENVFGGEDLINGFKEVLELINSNKDEAAKKWISEVMRKTFEVIPKIIVAEQGETIQKYETRISELEKQNKVNKKVIGEMTANLKGKLGITETMKRFADGQKGKGLYEQASKKEEEKATNSLSEMSLAETLNDRQSIPNFD